jgi:hypothetical protein
VSQHDGKDAPGPSGPAQEPGGRRKRTAAEEALINMWGDVRRSATRLEPGQLPPSGRPVRQFLHGLFLPVHLLRALWAEPTARRRYLQVAILQSLAILALGLTFMRSANEVTDEAEEAAERAWLDEASREQLERERFKLEVKLAAEEVAREALALSGAEDAPGEAERKQAIEEVTRKLENVASALLPPSPPAAVPPAPPVPAAEVKPPPRKLTFSIEPFEFWLSLFAAMQIAQWVVISLSREFHDVVSRDASLLTGVAPEDEELTPRIRLDLSWLRKKVSRRIRAFVVFLVGLPAVCLLAPVVYMLVVSLPYSTQLTLLLFPAWSAYWFVVFTASKSARAWDNAQAGVPWFLRAWKGLTTRVPGFRWGFLQGYGRFWTSRTASLFAPASEVEKLPWAFIGLSVVKALAIFPIAKSFLRPLFPVASAHLLAAQRAASGAPPSEASAPPAPTSANAA